MRLSDILKMETTHAKIAPGMAKSEVKALMMIKIVPRNARSIGKSVTTARWWFLTLKLQILAKKNKECQ
jgi:hypothetical protein